MPHNPPAHVGIEPRGVAFFTDDCVVVKSAPAGEAPVGLVAGQDCDEIMPGLSGVRIWREKADGSVLFGSVGGVTMAAFAQADGAGYESFAPRRPLIALVPED